MDLTTTVVSLIGVIVGAGGTYLGTALTERARWRRSHSIRWDERRLDAYIRYGDGLKRMHNLCVRISAARGFDYTIEPLTPEEGLPELASASTERSARWEAVLLLGGQETVDTARDWDQAVWRLEWYARGLLDDHVGWNEAVAQADATRHDFYAAARRDLGVPPPGEPRYLWPPSWLPVEAPDPTRPPGA